MKCCICGTVRNCGKYLDKKFNAMKQIETIFDECVIILYYDNSNDNTLIKLKEYEEKFSNFILYVNTNEMLQYRTHRIAAGRNKCLQIMREKYPSFEYFIMMDCDDKGAYNIKLPLLKHYLNVTEWDALSFNHPVGYYDSWALSIRPHIISHCFLDRKGGVKTINKLIKACPQNGLIKCLSAFNGFAIYRANKFVNCFYDGKCNLGYIPKNLINENIRYAGKFNLSRTNKEDCEHRSFHINAVLKNKAKIRISPHCLFV